MADYIPQALAPVRVILASPRDPPFQNREFIHQNARPHYDDLVQQTDAETWLRPVSDRDTHGEHLYRFRDHELQPNVHWLRPDYRPLYYTVATRSQIKDISRWEYNDGP